MIDLHIHTNCSDGVFSPIHILEIAEEMKLQAISITDHDTCEAYTILKDIDVSKVYSGKLVTGCELRTSYNKIPIEILGYNVNPIVINEWRKKYYSEANVLNTKNKNLEKLKLTCKKVGVKFDDSIIVTNVKQSFAQDLFESIRKDDDNKKYFNIDEWFKLDIFLRKYCSNPSSDFFVDRASDYPSLNEIISLIKEAEGVSFLAHPMVYSISNKIDFVQSISQEYKLDGLECYYPAFTQYETHMLLDYCIKNKLFISGGSDFHGTSQKGEIKLGIGKGNLKIPIEIVEEWAKSV